MNTTEMLELNKHIPTAQILSDVCETEEEIEKLEAALPVCQVLDDRALRLRLDVGISRRREFVTKLRTILDARAGDPPKGR